MIDFGNRAQDVERAVFEFSRPRRVLATDTDVTVRLSAELKAGPSLEMGGLNLWTKNILYRFVVYTGVLTLYIHQNLQRCILLLDSLN